MSRRDPFDIIADARPAVSPPSSAQTDRARATLDAAISAEHGRVVSWRRRAARTGASLAMAAALLFAVAFGVDRLRPTQEIVIANPPSVAESPVGDTAVSGLELRAIGEAIARIAPEGNATLVRREHRGGGPVRSGIDIYLDNGAFAYSRSESGIATAVAGASLERGWPVSQETVGAFRAAGSGDPAAALERFRTDLEGRASDGGLDVRDADVWRSALAAAPGLASDPQALSGLIYVLGQTRDVQLLSGEYDDRPVLVAVRADADGADNLVLYSDDGTIARYERLAADGSVVRAVDFAVERIDTDDLG